jgi:hypothetical protein
MTEKRMCQHCGERFSPATSRVTAMADWLDKITGSAFFGATAPDETSMKFTITVTAAEWREMRALVGADSTPSPQPLRPRTGEKPDA